MGSHAGSGQKGETGKAPCGEGSIWQRQQRQSGEAGASGQKREGIGLGGSFRN